MEIKHRRFLFELKNKKSKGRRRKRTIYYLFIREEVSCVQAETQVKRSCINNHQHLMCFLNSEKSDEHYASIMR